MNKHSKNSRTLDMYVRLCEGKCINKSEEARRFGVDERSIQRDIDDIRAFFDERAVNSSREHRTIQYDRGKKGFVLVGEEGSLMSNSEILAVSKILLESRAFTKKEISGILDKMIAGCVPQKNMKLVSDLIANERYHYVELHSQSSIKDKLWDLGRDIREQKLLEITYEKQFSGKETVKRVVEPAAILFSEYYFYLNAYLMEKKDGVWRKRYEYPATFRIDRIKDYRETGERFEIVYGSRFEEGEFRKRVQFMYAGALMKIQIRYTGGNVEAILDRLPTAKVVREDEKGMIVEAEVYGKGIIMWLLGQGKAVEVLRPAALREEVKGILREMLEKYE